MELPNLNKIMDVARLRYLQAIRESPERRNPDTMVGHFIPTMKRWRTAWTGRGTFRRMQADPFYDYLIARTRYYDQVIGEAVGAGVQRIISVGCGSDTRPYRFEDLLRKHDVRVVECDLPESIRAKQHMAERWRCFDHVDYVPIDLNDETWLELERWLERQSGAKFLVVMEGVSPYVNDRAFAGFLRFLVNKIGTGSHVAYDFKLRGVNDGLGRMGATQQPFRLPRAKAEVASFHEAQGLHLDGFELSSELCVRLVPGESKSPVSRFSEDGLVRLQVNGLCHKSELIK